MFGFHSAIQGNEVLRQEHKVVLVRAQFQTRAHRSVVYVVQSQCSSLLKSHKSVNHNDLCELRRPTRFSHERESAGKNTSTFLFL